MRAPDCLGVTAVANERPNVNLNAGKKPFHSLLDAIPSSTETISNDWKRYFVFHSTRYPQAEYCLQNRVSPDLSPPPFVNLLFGVKLMRFFINYI